MREVNSFLVSRSLTCVFQETKRFTGLNTTLTRNVYRSPHYAKTSQNKRVLLQLDFVHLGYVEVFIF